jgi:hypothetical protein
MKLVFWRFRFCFCPATTMADALLSLTASLGAKTTTGQLDRGASSVREDSEMGFLPTIRGTKAYRTGAYRATGEAGLLI